MAARDRIEDRLEDIENAYRRVVEDIQEQMEELDDRLEDLLDNIQRQLPDNAADLMQRSRKVNRDARRRLLAWSEQLQQAAQEFMQRDQPPAKAAAKKSPAKKSPAKKSPAKKSPAKKKTSSGATVKELRAQAAKLKIAGRSSMNKAQLQAAIRRAS